ncbi:transcriptional regulator [Streptomyces sp. V2]|uniref:Helix-turn-helix domain-containing protein n=1 Tax=Streptomyces niveiscabiei TaxID=164115 RepID=A0ABW9HZ28_9ACTN|nr:MULTISPECIES: helix-turn-helix transcriptional regulator [Streptomyces]MDX3381146.1 helix-turn-helix transcriptional regulator [Streptomyces niveiscabiei]PWG11922.1 transcriptional regulator [Streptomyces sp. V2]
MPVGGKPTVRSRRLGIALRRHREAAGLDQSAAAEAIMKSVSKVSRAESGQVSVSALEVRTLLDCYGVTDENERERLLNWAKTSNERGWWVDYQDTLRPDYADHITLESDATYILSWDPVLIPGLLQTPEYAEKVITVGPFVHSDEKVAELVEVRMQRQRRLDEEAVQYTAILWEPAITALADGSEVCADQLHHLLKVGRRQNVQLQILPTSAFLAATMSDAFTAFSYGVEPYAEVVTVRTPVNTTVVESPDDLATYANVFNRLRSAALSPTQSARRIRQALDNKDQQT